MLIRYSEWDGTQRIGDLDGDDLLAAMADDVLYDGDVRQALRRLLQRGAGGRPEQRLPGLQDLLKQLQRRRQGALDRYDLGSALEDITRKLEQVIQTERDGIRRRLKEGRDRLRRGEAPEAAQKMLERTAALHQQALDKLPPDPGGRVRRLQTYDFMDPEARRLFDEVIQSLRQHMLQPLLSGMQQALTRLNAEDLRRMREMLQDLNRLLRDRVNGDTPDFRGFQAKWGDQFPGVENLDELIEQLGRQIGQAQSLLESLSPGQRRDLEEMMRSFLLRDERLDAALAQLAMHLGELLPMEDLSRSYAFRGNEELTLEEAMKVMDELAQMDRLERQLRGVQSPADLDRLDRAEIERLLGSEAARDLERLRALTKKLEDAGYLEERDGQLRLTARAIRRIGEKALRDVFAHLRRDGFGRHAVDLRGAGGDRTDETKRYEFGDTFLLDLKETLMNAVERHGWGTPVRLCADDFEVSRTEHSTRAGTVVLLDMSRSMINNGCFLAAKKVALALAALIRDQFPRDHLSIVGFSLYAREFSPEQFLSLSWSEWNIGTNMQHGFELARRLLARHRGANKQIIMITDGEPTAHLEGGEAQFAYPPTARTIRETLREVQRCTRDAIVINTFMLEKSQSLQAFVDQMARINRGRAFFATPERLGEYVLVDYVTARRKTVS
jgi:uncharacterized protein with von Willebrand factor type A (vWA) domain